MTKMARRLRTDPTEAERALWRLLRGEAFAGWKFRRQHPVERYVLDFACASEKLAIEADGGQHCDSGHDEERDALLSAAGWRVLRFWNNHILGNAEGVAGIILGALQQSPPLPRLHQGRALLIGVGHPFRHDDAVGPLVAEAVAKLNLPDLSVLDHHGEGTDLMARWQGYDRVVLVDASCSGAVPGTVTAWDVAKQDLPAGMLPKGSHVFGVAEGIAMARLLGRLPKSFTVVAIEGRDFTAGLGLTPEVEAAVEWVMAQLTAP
jgi:hydrogenase maturation protease